MQYQLLQLNQHKPIPNVVELVIRGETCHHKKRELPIVPTITIKFTKLVVGTKT
jgi:hypothetical protein